RFKDRCGSIKIDIIRARRDRYTDPIPVETKPPGRAARIKRGWIEFFPFRIVEICAASVRGDIVRFYRLSRWLLVRASCFEVDLNDFRVAIAPLAFNKIDTFFGSEVDHRIRFLIRRIGICLSKCAASEKNQHRKYYRGCKAQARH